jgi:hypothetical protein
MIDLFHIYIDSNYKLIIEFSPILLVLLLVIILINFFLFKRNKTHYELVKMNITLGGVGQIEFKPSDQDVQIAHQIWTELVTRKAAIPIDEENDIITEIYNSWYELFTRIRAQICNVPGNLVRKNKSTQEIIRIATETLNKGLRPHLTKWHSRFRTWFENNSERLGKISPQELQTKYPKYDELMIDLKKVNKELIQYSEELKKIIHG